MSKTTHDKNNHVVHEGDWVWLDGESETYIVVDIAGTYEEFENYPESGVLLYSIGGTGARIIDIHDSDKLTALSESQVAGIRMLHELER